MIYVISDLHGYPFERFLELLEKAAFSAEDTLYVLGDVIDRGDDGVRYLLWMQQQKNAVLIMGNHEDMMLKCDFLFEPTAKELMGKLDYEQRVNLAVWMSNGAEPTVRGLFELGYEQRKAIYDYITEAPLYLEITAGGKEYVLVHSGLRDFCSSKELDRYSDIDLLWHRPPLSERYYDDKTVVFGHTPTWAYGDEYEGSIIITDTWIDIDAGAGKGLPPVLLRLDDMTQFML